MAVTPRLSLSRSVFVALLFALFALFALAPMATARDVKLSKAEARGLAAKTADKVRRDLESEGASDAGVAGCWRNSARRVSCYLEVRGYDAELDFRWTCMLRVVVDLEPRPSGRSRLKSRYGTAVCG